MILAHANFNSAPAIGRVPTHLHTLLFCWRCQRPRARAHVRLLSKSSSIVQYTHWAIGWWWERVTYHKTRKSQGKVMRGVESFHVWNRALQTKLNLGIGMVHSSSLTQRNRLTFLFSLIEISLCLELIKCARFLFFFCCCWKKQRFNKKGRCLLRSCSLRGLNLRNSIRNWSFLLSQRRPLFLFVFNYFWRFRIPPLLLL